MQTPDLESIRCFVAASETLNFRAAAQLVALSPPAFSERIANLEETVGARLFERTTRKVTATAAGLRMLPHARTLLAQAAALAQIASDDGRAPDVRLRIGTRFELGVSYLTPSLLDLEGKRPGRTLDLVFGDSPDLMRSLAERRVDCVVTSLRLTTPAIAYATLHEERYVLVGAPPLLERSPLSCAADARKHTLLDTLPSLPLFRYFLDAAPGAAAWTFENTRHLGAIAAVRHLAVQGAGVAVLPEYFTTGLIDDGKLQRAMPEVALNRDYFRLIWNADHVLTEEFELLAADLRELPLR